MPDETAPLVFKYAATDINSVRFTSIASAFNNRELMESKSLTLAWRVSYSTDEQETWEHFSSEIWSIWCFGSFGAGSLEIMELNLN